MATATTTTPAFSDLGATFNDATRFLEGGLWQNAVEEGGQGLGSVFHYTSDLTAVQTGLTAEVAAGQFTGDQLTHVQTILADITTALSAATASVNGGGTFGSVAAAETALRTAHLDILNVVNNDATLTNLATANGATGFLAAPAALADGVTAETAPHANLAEIGAIFNDATNRILGGVNADNKDAITADINAVITDMQALISANPHEFGGLTGVHADTVIRQLQLENTYINEAGTNPDAGRASNDNLLDIIDIVQGDTNLANMASQGGITGFAPFGDFANPTPAYQDNAAQTTFWANFIAQSNSLGQQAMALVGGTDQAAINTLVSDLQAFQKYITDFDGAQGGIFQARFDNELLGDTSTTGAEVAAMIKGLQTGNAALVAAAADEMHGNAADVGGNNVPVTGGTYNADGVTAADVLSTATNTQASSGTGGSTGTGTATSGTGTSTTGGGSTSTGTGTTTAGGGSTSTGTTTAGGGSTSTGSTASSGTTNTGTTTGNTDHSGDTASTDHHFGHPFGPDMSHHIQHFHMWG